VTSQGIRIVLFIGKDINEFAWLNNPVSAYGVTVRPLTLTLTLTLTHTKILGLVLLTTVER
jgi:hypothetical protein